MCEASEFRIRSFFAAASRFEASSTVTASHESGQTWMKLQLNWFAEGNNHEAVNAAKRYFKLTEIITFTEIRLIKCPIVSVPYTYCDVIDRHVLVKST